MKSGSCYAFIDESGNSALSKKPGASSHFILGVVLVEPDRLSEAEKGAEVLRQKHFQTGEMKSSALGKNISRRIAVLKDLLLLPINICIYSVNKDDIRRDSGLQYKKVFYKYLHKRVYGRIARFYSSVVIASDEHGTVEFMNGFRDYIKEKCFGNLFPDAEFSFSNSKANVLIQVADIFAGTAGRILDASFDQSSKDVILRALEGKLMEFDIWPRIYERMNSRKMDSLVDSGDNGRVRDYSYRAIDSYIGGLPEMDKDSEVREMVLEYLARESFSERDGYVTSGKLVDYLDENGFKEINEQFLRIKVISHFRDNGIIIASSPSGYKIPTRVSDVLDYVQHCSSIICPMKDRLNLARTVIQHITHARVDILTGGALDFLKNDATIQMGVSGGLK